LSPEIIASALILLSALLHAGVNTLIKVSDDGLLLRGCMNGLALLVAAPFLLVVAPPAPELWPVLGASVMVHALYPFFLVWAYRSGDLSAVYPIVRGTVPLLVAAFAWLAIGQQPTVVGFGGIVLVSLAVASFALVSRGAGVTHGKAIALALATGLIVAAYTVIDAAGLRLAATPFQYIVWLFMLDGAVVALLVACARRHAVMPFLRANGKAALTAGALGILSYALALFALALGPVAEIAALRETSIVFAAILGAWLLKEPLGRMRLTAALVAFAGIVLMHLGR
jgi:drug/metabolite transporter (DMT)-like permease